MKSLLALLVIPATVLASECVLQDRTVSATQAQIQERSRIHQTVVDLPQGGRRCIVEFRARIANEWYSATGDYDWSDGRPREEACAVAVARAESAVQQQSQPSHVRTDKILICSDRPDQTAMNTTNPGTAGRESQFRPHPDFPRRFWHNGTQCRWFLDSAFRGSDIHTYQGVICQIKDDFWVVVDKF